MRVLLVLALVGCQGGSEMYPVDPGGPNPGGVGMMVDAASIDAPDPDAGNFLMGRVCLVTDVRGLDCAGSGAGGITVTLGTNSALTTATGAFSIVTPTGSNLVWRATGTDMVKSVMAFGPSKTIPIISTQTYLDLQNSSSVTINPGMGSIFARVVKGAAATPQAGATATVDPVAAFAIKYDGNAPLNWTELSTGAAGTVWIPGAGPGANTVTITPASGATAMEMLTVEDQAITYATIALP